MPYAISPNNPVIEKLIGHYRSGMITTIYGNASSGKTTSCLLAAIETARNKGKVIYIDTESSFDTDRLSQLNDGDISPILENIFLLQPKSFEDQDDIIHKLYRLCDNEKIRLVVVDTIGNHYRVILKDDPRQVNNSMVVQLQILVRIARDLDKAVIMTNQASADLNEKDGIRMVGGNMMQNMSKCVIELHKKEDLRFASLIKNEGSLSEKKSKIRFHIREKGLFL